MTEDDKRLCERLERVAEFGGTHLDGLWTEAAQRIRELYEENDMLASLISAKSTSEKPKAC